MTGYILWQLDEAIDIVPATKLNLVQLICV